MKNNLIIQEAKFLTIFLLINFVTINSFATNYYTATTGNDSNTGTLSSPWKTLTFSVGKLIAGDTLFVRGGIYTEAVSVWASGTSLKQITITAYNGELPIIDGQNTYPTDSWDALMNLGGSYINFSGFEVRNSSNNNSMGVQLYGSYCKVSKCNVHNNNQQGILIRGDYGIVEDCQVWQSCLSNVNGKASVWGSGLSAARDPVNGITDNATIRRNVVYNNWGEGLSTYEAEGTIIEDNIVYDNWAQIFYISDASNVICQRNIFYQSSTYTVGRYATVGAALADEVASKPRSTNNQIINNFFLKTPFSAFSWTIVSGSGLTNVLIANNTFVNSPLSTGNINNGNNIINNIFTTSGSIPSSSGINWSNNLWQGARPANAVGTGDVLGNPILNLSGSTLPGQLTANYFQFLSTSPAINKGISLNQVTIDYFKTIRNNTPCIGGYEYVNSSTEVSKVNQSTFSIYPNPATKDITVELPSFQSGERFQVISITGRTVKDFIITSPSMQISVDDLPCGLYLVRNVSSTMRFIKQ